MLDNSTRYRNPEAVAEEIARGMRKWGFRSFKFRDPLFGRERSHVHRLIESIGRLPRKIQFSIETRIELMPPELLRMLQRVGLTSITVGIETPDEAMLKSYHRASDRRRPAAGIHRKLPPLGPAHRGGLHDRLSRRYRGVDPRRRPLRAGLNPTYANFNVVTPYPGTAFYESEKSRGRIADCNFTRYSSYAPVMKYEHLTAADIECLHAKSFNHFYFRWEYLRENATQLWPLLRCLGLDRKSEATPPTTSSSANLKHNLRPTAKIK